MRKCTTVVRGSDPYYPLPVSGLWDVHRPSMIHHTLIAIVQGWICGQRCPQNNIMAVHSGLNR